MTDILVQSVVLLCVLREKFIVPKNGVFCGNVSAGRCRSQHNLTSNTRNSLFRVSKTPDLCALCFSPIHYVFHAFSSFFGKFDEKKELCFKFSSKSFDRQLGQFHERCKPLNRFQLVQEQEVGVAIRRLISRFNFIRLFMSAHVPQILHIQNTT